MVKKLNKLKKVPNHWPDSENVVKTDMLDYVEIEYFDSHLERIISELEKKKFIRKHNNSRYLRQWHAFSRVKGQVFPYDNR